MITIAKLHSSTNGNSHTVRSVLFNIMSLYMVIDIEMLFAFSFATLQENHYENSCCEINKENVQKKHFIYK
jgi:hypothetical protein